MNELEKIFNDLEKYLVRNFNELLATTNNSINNLFGNFTVQDVKINESNNRLNVEIPIPNLTKDHQINISVNQNNLIIEGELSKQNKLESDYGRSYSKHYSEYLYRAIPLSYRVSTKGGKAVYEKGVLKVSLNKVGKIEQDNIDIEFR